MSSPEVSSYIPASQRSGQYDHLELKKPEPEGQTASFHLDGTQTVKPFVVRPGESLYRTDSFHLASSVRHLQRTSNSANYFQRDWSHQSLPVGRHRSGGRLHVLKMDSPEVGDSSGESRKEQNMTMKAKNLEPLNPITKHQTAFSHHSGVQAGKPLEVQPSGDGLHRAGSFNLTSSVRHPQSTPNFANYFQRGWSHQSLPVGRRHSGGRFDVKKMIPSEVGVSPADSRNDQNIRHYNSLKPQNNSYSNAVPDNSHNMVVETSASTKRHLKKSVRWPDQCKTEARPLSSSYSEDKLNELGKRKEKTKTASVLRSSIPKVEESFDDQIDTPMSFGDDLLQHSAPIFSIESLHSAIDDGNKEAVQSLLVQAKGEALALATNGMLNGMTPLQRACKKELAEVAALLVKHGAEVNTNNTVAMPIALAYLAKNIELCAGLITVGSKLPPAISAKDILALIINADDADALYDVLDTTTKTSESIYNLDTMNDYIVLLETALSEGKFECAAVLILYGVDYQQSFPVSPLTFAANHHCLELACELCLRGEEFTSTQSIEYKGLMGLAEQEQNEDAKLIFAQKVANM